MKLTYKLNEKDYIDFNLYHIQYADQAKNSLRKQRMIGSALFIGFGVITAFFANMAQMIVAIGMIAMGVYWYTNFYSIAKKRITKATHKAVDKGSLKDIFEELSIELGGFGITQTMSDGQEVTMTWDQVKHVVYLEEYIYLFFTDNGALIFPNRIFIDDEKNIITNLIEKNYKEQVEILEVTF